MGGVLASIALASMAFLIACGTSSEGAPPSPSPTAKASPKPTPSPTVSPTPSPSPSPTPSPAPPPLIPGTPWPGPVNVPILMYHHVNSAPPPADVYEAALTTSDADFSRQLAHLRCAGYGAVTLAQLFDGMYNGAPLPARPVVLTFDDGYADAFTNAFPLLRWHGVVGSFSIVTGYVDIPPYLTWAQIGEMANAGMEIIAHSVTHEDLNRSPDDIVRYQVAESKRVLEEHLGRPVNYFTYPSGEPFYRGSQARQRRVVDILRESGYQGALAIKNSPLQDPANPFALSRIRVMNGVDIGKFAENLGGPPPEAIGC